MIFNMIRRLFYMGLGAVGAVWVMRKLQALRPDHVARRAVHGARDLLGEARAFAGDVTGAAAHRETELRARFGLDSVDVKALDTDHHFYAKDGR